jgi:hypothetical protein
MGKIKNRKAGNFLPENAIVHFIARNSTQRGTVGSYVLHK